MTDELENTVPEDDKAAEKPDAVVILEDKKPDADAKGGQVIETPKDAATEGVEALSKSLEKAKQDADSERTGRIAAESRAKQAETEAATAKTRINAQTQQNIDANRLAATNAKSAAQAELEKNRKKAAELTAEGKFDEAEEARMAAFEAKQEIKNADNYLVNLDREVERLAAAPAERPKSDSEGTVDPVTGIKFTPKTFAYIQAQGDNWKDQDFRIACDAANKAATRKGIKPDTDEWNEFMDSKLVALGFKEAPVVEVEVTEQPKPDPKPAVVAKKPAGASNSPAPSRAVAGSSGVAKKHVKMTSQEREFAQSLVDSVPELFKGENPDQLYARNKQGGLDEHGEDWLRTPTNSGA